MFKPLLAQKPQRTMERKRPPVPYVKSAPSHRLCCWGVKEVSDRLWLTRAL